MSSRARSWSLVLISLALAAGCGPDEPAPDAPPPSTVPATPAGVFELTSRLDVHVPPAAAPLVAELTAATDGPDDPSRYLLDRMIETLPDGTAKTIALQAAPYVAAYVNDQLSEVAPHFAPGMAALATGLSRIASRLGTLETWRIDEAGAAVRTIHGVRFELGSAVTVVQLSDLGIPDLTTRARVALDGDGRLTILEHAHGLPYGVILRAGLDRAVARGVVPTASGLASALGTLVDCDRLAALVGDQLGLGAEALYRLACRTAVTALASELDARLDAIDEAPLELERMGSATGVDLNGDGAMDELRAGTWAGTLSSGAWSDRLGAASFAGRTAP